MVAHTKNIAESFSFSESIAKHTVKYSSRTLAFSESLTKDISKNVSETLAVIDTILRNANAVVFDLKVSSDVLEKDQMARLADSPPVGYTNFQTLHPGDYTYQDALVGIRITGPNTSGQAGVSALRHNVDIEDITERGEATVASSGTTRVNFTKSFSTAPEVVAAFKSGATLGIPKIIGITTTYFDVELYDTSNSQITGDITYAIIGY